MNGKELLLALGEIGHEYYEEAETVLLGQSLKKKRLPKPVLLAAVIAMMLLLVGCAVIYVFGLRDIIITQEEFIPPAVPGEEAQSAQIRNAISLQGYVGTPGYLANQEWNAFLESYQMPEEEPEIPTEQRLDYLSYGCFFQDEIDKVDEICEKYGLNTLGIAWIEEEIETTFDALGIDGLLLQDAPANAQYHQGYYYGDGTFDIPFALTLTGDNSPWEYPLDMRMRYVMKSSFDGVAASIGPLESYEEWTCTTAQGVDVLMALSESNALMIVDQTDAFLTVLINNVRAGDITEGAQMLTREGMEAAAEVIDFMVDPQEVDVAAAQARYDALGERLAQERAQREEALENKGYRERILQLAEKGYDSINAVYALMDIDGNGIDELLLGQEDYFYNICTLDGDRSKSLIWFIDSTKAYVCENGVLMYTDDGFNGQSYRYAKIVGTSIEYLDWVRYDSENTDAPWIRVCRKNEDGTLSPVFTPEDQNLVDQPISEEEFHSVLASYQKLEVPTVSIKEYLTAIDHPFIQDSIEDYLKYYISKSASPENIRYALRDLNGDGEPELLLGAGDTPFGEVVMLVDGMIDLVLSDGTRNGLYLCEGNIIEKVEKNDTFESHTYYRIEGHTAVEIDCVCYDAFANPDNPWYRYTGKMGEPIYEQWLTADEYNAVLSAHPRIAIPMQSLLEADLE